MGFLDVLGNTLKSLGGVATAEPGVLWDLASAPFDDKDDDFSSILKKVGNRYGQLFDPLTNTKTITGKVFSPVMNTLNTAWSEGVDKPLATALTMASHLDSNHPGESYVGALFSGDDWAKAYKIADNAQKGMALGESFAFATTNDKDPLSSKYVGTNTVKDDVTGKTYQVPKTPFGEQTLKDHPTLGPLLEYGAAIGTQWYLDPGVLAGKGASIVRERQLGKIKLGDRRDFDKVLSGEKSSTGIAPQDWSGRADKGFNFIAGDNKLKRPLSGDEIYKSDVGLQRTGGGIQIAGLMHDATQLPTAAEQQATLRRVYAVGAGDVGQITRLRAEIQSSGAIADALENLTSGGTVKLQRQALQDDLRYDPAVNADFDRQLQNLDENGDVSKFVKTWKDRISDQEDFNLRLKDAAGTLDYLPGTGNFGGANRALKRENHTRVFADKVLDEKREAMIQKARDFAHRDSHTTVFQASLNHMPLMLAHSTALLTAPYKGVASFADGLRQTHLLGFAKLDDWNGSVNQLDSLMREGETPDHVRHAVLTSAYKARTEADKAAAIEQAEGASFDGIIGHIQEKHGITVDRDWVKQVVLNGQNNRGLSLGRLSGGRIYATSAAPADVALRQKGMANARLDQRAQQGKADGKVFGQLASEDRTTEINDMQLRADQVIEDNGLPAAFPLTVAQLGNRVPLVDIRRVKQLTNDQAWVDRFARYGKAWKTERIELDGLQQRLASGKVGSAVVLQKAIRAKRATLDSLEGIGSILTRVWKFSALFRIGYPVRILLDDHTRIANKLHYSTFMWGNGSEGLSNWWYNADINYKSGRYAAAATAYKADRARRSAILEAHLGHERGAATPTREEWTKFREALADPNKDQAIVSKVDPMGKIRSLDDYGSEAKSLAASVRGHKNSIDRWNQQIADAETKHTLGIDHGVDIKDLRNKVENAKVEIAHKEAGRAAAEAQVNATSADAHMNELWALDEHLSQGQKGYLPEKAVLGERKGVKAFGHTYRPAYAAEGAGYKNAASSEDSTAAILDTLDGNNVKLISGGGHRTVTPDQHGYYYIYTQVLNNQFQHSPEFMAFITGKVNNPQEFAKWLKEPEQAYIRDRVSHFSRNPEDWGSRIQQVVQDYLPTPAIRRAVANGRVKANQIDKMVPQEFLPPVHTDLADINSGRNSAVRMLDNGLNRMMGWLATAPTDRLSRHPFFNSMYRQHVTEQAGVRAGAAAKEGRLLTESDHADIERIGRRKALKDLQETLWDVSAHSHSAHVMRFLSPFFAAHQESLTRWWRIASDDPSMVRRFQLAFDAPRKMGLVYDTRTGQPVPEGEDPSAYHHVLLRLPGPENSAANKWLKKMQGGHYWNVSESSFNLILQNGITNPGAGPLVTVPAEMLLQKYGSPEFERVVRAMNPYPMDSPMQGFLPAWSKRLLALKEGNGSREYNDRYMDNWADAEATFRLDHNGRPPTEREYDKLHQKVTQRTHLDLWLMAASNAASPFPAKPNSKYTAVQMGWTKIRSQMNGKDRDWKWGIEQMHERFGDVFDAMMATQGTNIAKLDMNYGEVNAMKVHRPLLDVTDPTLARMVIGPEVAMNAKADTALGRYDQTAQAILKKMKTSPTSGETYLGSKSLDDMTMKTVADAGWQQYDELTNYLTVQAQQLGLQSYEDSSSLRAMKSAGIDYIKQHNFAFAQAWDQPYGNGGYDGLVEDMRKIASDKKLQQDPARTKDVYALGQYLALRDQVTSELRARAAAGGSKTIDAQANADLARGMYAGVQYLRNYSGYFADYMYSGIIEKDPYLNVTGVGSG